MALERLQARAPAITQCWPNTNPVWLFVPKQLSDYTTCWTEQERRCIGLKRVTLDRLFMIQNESPCIMDNLIKLIVARRLLLVLAIGSRYIAVQILYDIPVLRTTV
jgi:hypothetical protein